MPSKKQVTYFVVPLLTFFLVLALRSPVFSAIQPSAIHNPEIKQLNHPQPTSKSESSGDVSCWNGELGYTNFTSQYSGYSKRKVSSVAFSPDGKFLASGGWADGLRTQEESIKIWNVQERRFAYNLDKSRTFDVMSLAFSPNGNFLVVGGQKGEVELWNWRNQQQKTPLDQQLNKQVSVSAIAVSADNRTVASGGRDLRGNFLRLWTITNNKLREAGTIPRNAAVYTLAFSPDGRFLAVAGKGSTVEIWSFTENKWIESFDAGTPEVFSVAFSPDGKLLASTGRETQRNLNRAIKLWSLADRQLLTTLDGHGDRVNAITFSPDGAYLASVSSDSTIRLWDVKTGQFMGSISTERLGLVSSERLENLLTVGFHPSGKQLAIGGVDKIVRLLRTKQCP